MHDKTEWSCDRESGDIDPEHLSLRLYDQQHLSGEQLVVSSFTFKLVN